MDGSAAKRVGAKNSLVSNAAKQRKGGPDFPQALQANAQGAGKAMEPASGPKSGGVVETIQETAEDLARKAQEAKTARGREQARKLRENNKRARRAHRHPNLVTKIAQTAAATLASTTASAKEATRQMAQATSKVSGDMVEYIDGGRVIVPITGPDGNVAYPVGHDFREGTVFWVNKKAHRAAKAAGSSTAFVALTSGLPNSIAGNLRKPENISPPGFMPTLNPLTPTLAGTPLQTQKPLTGPPPSLPPPAKEWSVPPKVVAAGAAVVTTLAVAGLIVGGVITAPAWMTAAAGGAALAGVAFIASSAYNAATAKPQSTA